MERKKIEIFSPKCVMTNLKDTLTIWFISLVLISTVRLLLNPNILDFQSNPSPSQICDLESKSKSDFQNGSRIQSKSSYFWKKKIWDNKS